MLTRVLTTDELEFLQSLNESDLTEFLRTIPPSEFDSVVAQLAGETIEEPSSGNYADDRSRRAAEIINAKTAAAQEIGPLHDVRDPQRRERCSQDLELYAMTYFSATFYLPFASYQHSMIDAFQQVILDGGRECHAVRRGGLKSTIARVATQWAAVNGHRRFPVLVGATDDKANEHRENFFKLLASSPILLDDFPELTPLILKWRQPKRQYRLGGRLLAVHPKDDRGRIVFADIDGAPSCETHIAPYSINATDVSGLSYVDRLGVTIRPDLLVFDDVQTPQSAGSPLMTEERDEMISKTFCGLAGLGEKLAAIFVGTVREHGDLVERFLDRKIHPDWHGKRYPSILKLPTRMDLWDGNAALLSQGATPEEGKALSQAHYERNREAMDEGGRVAWECDKLEDEPSALYSLMCVRALNPDFFRCEIQQEGLVPVNTSGVKLVAQDLLRRLSRVRRGIVPAAATHLTAFVDSSDQVLWGMVVAWTKDFSGWIVDYRTWPDQGRPVFYKSDLGSTISGQLPGSSWEEAFVHAHNQFEAELLADFPTDDGKVRSVDLLLKDWSDGGQKPRIESQIAASPNRSRIRPSKGFAPKPGRKPLHLWGDVNRDRHNGSEWVEKRSENPAHVQFNANIWKSHVARRLLTTVGAPSALLLPGEDERANRLLVEHLTAENPKQMVYDGTPGIVWEQIPGRDNDWFDCLVGCTVAASMLGCGLIGEVSAVKERRTFQIPGRR